MRVLITGHTGLKGSLLSLALTSQDHEVLGISNELRLGSLAEIGLLDHMSSSEVDLDICDRVAFSRAVREFKPDIALHFAAISTISEGLSEPARTFRVNVAGTLNFLDLMGEHQVDKSLVITSDKVYDSKFSNVPHDESSPLWGIDPYSASKASADFLAQEFLRSSQLTRGVIARAGNVIGPFDMAPDRLMKDAQTALRDSQPLTLRNPSYVRPWQDVRDVLNGYLSILNNIEMFHNGEAVNVGPKDTRPISVKELVSLSAGMIEIKDGEPVSSIEVANLRVSSEKIKSRIGWETEFDPIESFRDSLRLYERVNAQSDISSKRALVLEYLADPRSSLLENAARLKK